MEPARELTLLFTDLVDSTRLYEDEGEERMAALWALHDRMARALIREHGGLEIGRSDGFLVHFVEPTAALRFALGYHAALRTFTPPVRARVGLHHGSASLRRNSPEDCARGATPFEVDGAALPIAARIMSVALGGQTLLSTAAKDRLEPGTARLASHGFWRLKGLPEPIELWEAGDEWGLFVPPPDGEKAYGVVAISGEWRPRRDIPHTLPAERDSFIGRHTDLAQVAAHLHAGARLVSVLGIGGIGKSRLAIRFGWTWLGEFPGGVWFCDLSLAHDRDGIAQGMALGLGIPLGRGDALEQIGHAIAGRERCLVLVDNFEQVTEHARETLGRWMDRAPLACFVVTSRSVLGLAGEVSVMLAPLSSDDACTLFSRRAQAVRPGWRIGADEGDTLVRLVRLLDCLPLAIELAAARVRVMTPRLLLERIGERFRLLAATGRRTDRQATLRNTFDWSWGLLGAAEKSVLAQLSVFDGSFTLGAAEAIVDLSGCADAPWVVDAVQSLVEKSLVRTSSDGRFELLGMVQEYARDRLREPTSFDQAGPEMERATVVRHYRHFTALAPESLLAAADAIEYSNVHAACRYACREADGAAAATALTQSWRMLRLRGPYGTALELADLVLALPALALRDTVAAQWVRGATLLALGRSGEAVDVLGAAADAASELADARWPVATLTGLADALCTLGRWAQAASALERAAAAVGADPSQQCMLLMSKGAWAQDQALLDQARACYEEALRWAWAAGDLRSQGNLIGNLGGLSHAQGRLDQAREWYEQALDLARRCADLRLEGNTLCNLGLLLLGQGQQDQARDRFEATLRTARHLGNPAQECVALCNLGLVDEAQQQWDAALRQFDAAGGRAAQLGDPRLQGLARMYQARVHAQRQQWQACARLLQQASAHLQAHADPISLGLLHCTQAMLATGQGDTRAATHHWACATALAADTGAGPQSELGQALARSRAISCG